LNKTMVDESSLVFEDNYNLKKRKHSAFADSQFASAVVLEASSFQENTTINFEDIKENKEDNNIVISQDPQEDHNGGSVPASSQFQLNRVVSPDAVLESVAGSKKIKMDPTTDFDKQQDSDVSSSPAATATSNGETEISTVSAVEKPTDTSEKQNGGQDSISDNQNSGQEEPSQEMKEPEEERQPRRQLQQQAAQPHLQQQQMQDQAPNIVDEETPPASPRSTPPSSPGSVVGRVTHQSAGLKAAPAYSFQPELTRQLVNQPIKPEQMASQKYLKNFLRVKQKFKERAERRRENRKHKLQKRSRRGALLEAPPLLRNDFTTSSRYFHPMKENSRNDSSSNHGGGYLIVKNRSMPESPINNRGWQDSRASCNYHHPVLENYQDGSFLPDDKEHPIHPYFTPPDSPHSQRQIAPTPERATSPASSLLANNERPVSVGDLTNEGKGAEWTCVFSGVAQSMSDQLDNASFEEHFQRLLGYRLLFDGKKTGVGVGDEARMLAPLDERTRMVNGIKKMDGILRLKGEIYSSDPSNELSPVLWYGWRPNEDGHADDYGLDNFWSGPISRMNLADRQAHSVQVTFEGHTGNGDHPWSEHFPFGTLFGLDMQFNAELVELQDKYWTHGVVAVFHWVGEEQCNHQDGMVKEFALFVPTLQVHSKDIKIDTAALTPYDTAQMDPEYVNV
jgi:hypothetical protein